jgi:hypothetical protein
MDYSMLELKPHKNAVIGIKKLSAADLGRSDKSNQTHIGLFENTLNCIDNLHLIDFCYLVTEKETKKLLCLLDYIENPDGTFRSPKIRKGSNEELVFEGQELNSVVREIRKIVTETGRNKDWYLIWFATDNQHLVFILFEFRSEFFDLLSSKLDGIKERQQFGYGQESFFKIFSAIKPYLND